MLKEKNNNVVQVSIFSKLKVQLSVTIGGMPDNGNKYITQLI